jgi:NAD(P)-dependent dehydrogenase (short-subunit alcohol dehydrogenase family)
MGIGIDAHHATEFDRMLDGTFGIGFAVAHRAAEEGALVLVASSSEAKVAQAKERLAKSAGATVNLSSEESIKSFFDRVEAFDHLVYTAGETPQPTPASNLKTSPAAVEVTEEGRKCNSK